MKMNSVVKLCVLTAAICTANVSYAAGSTKADVTISAKVVGSCTITATPVLVQRRKQKIGAKTRHHVCTHL